MFKDRMFKGFTLAEVLITLTIIGVISAMTIPSLQSNVGTQALEKQTLKFYSQLQNMVDRYKVDNGVDTIGDDFGKEENITKYLKIAKKCASASDCFASSYTHARGSSFNSIPSASNGRIYQLMDGTAISFSSGRDIWVDVNGPKKPNKVGYDMWKIAVQRDGRIDGGGSSATWNMNMSKATINTNLNLCLNSGTASGCFGHFIRNGFKFDY